MSKLLISSVLILVCPVPELRVLMVRRAPDRRTFPNSWAFPGGQIETDDEGSLMACALRETFEETGIMPGSPGPLSALPALRAGLANGTLTFSQVCQQLGFQIPVESLSNLGRRVTPPLGAFRFDTVYFLMETHQMDPVDVGRDGEHAEGAWMAPAEILARWQGGQALMHPPVRDVLEILVRDGLTPTAISRMRGLANDPDTLYRRIAMHPGIELIPLETPTLPPATHTNCYLVGEHSFVIIDPGSPDPGQQALLESHIEERRREGHQPQAILLTHHHVDHIGGVARLQARYQLPVAAHPLTAERLISQGISVTHPLEDGACWDLGLDPFSGLPWQLQALWTPGHAPGHLCFLDLRHRVALVGDLLAGFGTILIAAPDGHMRTYLDSLEALASSQLTLAFPAHGPPITDPTAVCRYYIRHRLGRENKILELLQEGRSSLEELLPRVYDELSPVAYPLARLSLQAHLVKLLEEARIRQDGEAFALNHG